VSLQSAAIVENYVLYQGFIVGKFLALFQ